MARKSALKKSAEDSWGSPKKRDQYTVVLEDLRSHFKAFGENLDITRESLEKKIGDFRAEVRRDVAALQLELARTNERIDRLEQANLELLKEIRENAVSRSEFELLREKVRKLEAK